MNVANCASYNTQYKWDPDLCGWTGCDQGVCPNGDYTLMCPDNQRCPSPCYVPGKGTYTTGCCCIFCYYDALCCRWNTQRVSCNTCNSGYRLSSDKLTCSGARVSECAHFGSLTRLDYCRNQRVRGGRPLPCAAYVCEHGWQFLLHRLQSWLVQQWRHWLHCMPGRQVGQSVHQQLQLPERRHLQSRQWCLHVFRRLVGFHMHHQCVESPFTPFVQRVP